VVVQPATFHCFGNESDVEVRLLSISVPEHQRIFDAVASADREILFATITPELAMQRVAAIGEENDSVFARGRLTHAASGPRQSLFRPPPILGWRTAIIVIAAVATLLITFGNSHTDEEFYFAAGRAITNGACRSLTSKIASRSDCS
jgi:hypothetical protein